MTHILIVEDDVELAAAAEAMLRRQDYSVAVAPTSQAALDAMADENLPIDLVVLDLNLAGERGETLIRRSERLQLPQPQIIITSAEPRTDCAYALLELGAAACLTKPYLLEQLLEEVRNALRYPEPDIA